MKLTTLLIILPFMVFSQIDYYRNQYDRISSKDSVVRIDWTLSASKNAPLYFDHVVNFVNEKNEDIVGSTVYATLYHNNKKIRTFKFKTADHINNFITVDRPIKLKEGDKVYFVFELYSKNNNESYVFNINPRLIMEKDKLNKEFEKKSTVVAQNKTEEKQSKTKIQKYKPNRQQDIGYEIGYVYYTKEEYEMRHAKIKYSKPK